MAIRFLIFTISYYSCNTASKFILMRVILSISMPEKEKKKIEERARAMGKTVSGYVLYAVKMEQDSDLISEDELVKSLREAEKEYKTGKMRTVKSLDELMD